MFLIVSSIYLATDFSGTTERGGGQRDWLIRERWHWHEDPRLVSETVLRSAGVRAAQRFRHWLPSSPPRHGLPSS